MKPLIVIVTVVTYLVTVDTSTRAQDSAKPDLEAQAMTQIERMSGYLAGLKSFGFKVEADIDAIDSPDF